MNLLINDFNSYLQKTLRLKHERLKVIKKKETLIRKK